MYKTGALHSRLELDYETKSVYFITVSIYNTFDADQNQRSNATVQINIIVIKKINKKNFFFFLFNFVKINCVHFFKSKL